MSIRTEKVASTIKRALATNISNLAAENKLGFASISAIKLSKDLKIANVFINLFTYNSSTPVIVAKFIELLNNKKGLLRSVVAKEVRLKITPELRFFYDDTLDQMQHIDNLLNDMKTNFPYAENYGDESVYKFDDETK